MAKEEGKLTKHMSTPTKYCPQCNKTLPVGFFQKNGHTPAGIIEYKPVCKACYKAKIKVSYSHRQTEAEHVNEIIDQHKLTVNDLCLILLEMARFDKQRLEAIEEAEFWSSYSLSKDIASYLEIDFKTIKKYSQDILNKEFGAKFQRNIVLGKGRYLIIGDSHGKHSKHKIWDLVANINKALKIDKIIHVGHVLDDEETVNYHLDDYKNMIVLTKKEEIRPILSYMREHGFNFGIVRDRLQLGKLTVTNQDVILNEYTYQGINALDPYMFDSDLLINSHKHEMDSKTTPEDKNLLYMGVGCLCEPFVVKTVRMMDWWESRKRTKVCYTETFKAYRRYQEMSKLWEQGVYIVEVGENGEYTPIPCRIQKVNEVDYAIAWFDKIITSTGIKSCNDLTLITGDAQIPFQQPETFSIIDQIAKRFKFNAHINVGDFVNNSCLNHHELSRNNRLYMDGQYLIKEYALATDIMEKTCKWAKEQYFHIGNHERFVQDYVEHNPQFFGFLDIYNLLPLTRLNIKTIPLKQSYIRHNARYLHGNIEGYGCAGNLSDKLAKIYNARKTPVCIGHIHCPTIRHGVYSVGLCGKMDQTFNEPMASRWMAGFGISTSYNGISWITTIPIVRSTNPQVIIDRKRYIPLNCEEWDPDMDDMPVQVEIRFCLGK